MNKNKVLIAVLIGYLCINAVCSSKKQPDPSNPNPPPPATSGITAWITTGDRANLLQKQPNLIPFASATNTNPTIEIDSTITYQTVDGFGYTLTGGSAYHINRLSAAQKSSLLLELFGSNENSIGISYLRVSIGASDLNAEVFSYNDMPAGQTDVNLTNFSLSKDTVDVIPLLKEILLINPNIRIMGSPWSAPVWMKDNASSIGGSLQPQYYSVYAQYFAKYIQAMRARGITIDAITPQNEPQHGGNNPSMVMSATQQADFIKNHLGPAFQSASLSTKIIIWDHNCDNPNYPITILNDPAAKQYVNGSAFHLYNGDISALSTVHAAHPDKHLYFTEQWTAGSGSFNGDLKWHLRNVIIGSMRNWSKVALEWNLASDGSYNPHTPGGCTECKGALTLDGAINRNVAYYIVAHASKFVPPGSVRIESNNAATIFNAAFKTPDGKKILIAINDGNTAATFNIKFKGQIAVTTLAAGAAATYTW
ncbi:MAG TPA: glycoside hydrolase family 30 beta sandwich domain-containing protein [Chitinophagaceae bacterium]|nr:glycoside hydrolase family 30 beta sandwich domain-containing protein [Chitinophagaceae bacterium]